MEMRGFGLCPGHVEVTKQQSLSFVWQFMNKQYEVLFWESGKVQAEQI